jgi:hypothetical protein
LYPEYSIPGFAGAKVIDDRINNTAWANESIIIAGIDGLDKAEYTQLCKELAVNVSSSNAPDSVPNEQWVNCCVTWIKDQNGTVKKWVQPKIRPSWSEASTTCHDMFCGSTVYIYKAHYEKLHNEQRGYPCNFFTLICYDWVAANYGTTVCDEVLKQLNEECGDALTPVHWVFVVQHNPKPNHPTFLNSTYQFLTDISTYTYIDKRDAIVLHANTAASPQPSRSGNGAFTACIFSPSVHIDSTACRPTVCMQTRKLRGSENLLLCKDVVFREMGECIHSFKVRVPHFIRADHTDRTCPLLDAKVYATNGVVDPRLCGSGVPAVIKWINDSLDCVKLLSKNELRGCPLKNKADSVQLDVTSKVRVLESQIAANCINWATCSFSENKECRNEEIQKNTDLWDQPEIEALEHIIYSLTYLGIAYDFKISSSSHGILCTDESYIQVIAIRGETFLDCLRHYDKVIPRSGTDPILVIARNRDNLKPVHGEYSKFYETDGDGSARFLDYPRLANCCRDAQDEKTLRGCLNEFIPREPRII